MDDTIRSIRPRDILELRRQATSRSFAASELPQGVEAAYDVAAGIVGTMNRPIAAWKLGATTPVTRRAFATDEVYYGGLVAGEVAIAAVGGTLPTVPALRAEAEIALRLARDIEPNEAARLVGSSGTALFDAWAPVLEAPYSCVANLPEAGLAALLMDRCAAGALYLGAPRTDLSTADGEATLEIRVDAESLTGAEVTASLVMAPSAAALRFVEIAAANGTTLRKGQWISTGGVTACVPLPFGRPITLLREGEEVFTIVVPPYDRKSLP